MFRAPPPPLLRPPHLRPCHLRPCCDSAAARRSRQRPTPGSVRRRRQRRRLRGGVSGQPVVRGQPVPQRHGAAVPLIRRRHQLCALTKARGRAPRERMPGPFAPPPRSPPPYGPLSCERRARGSQPPPTAHGPSLVWQAPAPARAWCCEAPSRDAPAAAPPGRCLFSAPRRCSSTPRCGAIACHPTSWPPAAAASSSLARRLSLCPVGGGSAAVRAADRGVGDGETRPSQSFHSAPPLCRAKRTE